MDLIHIYQNVYHYLASLGKAKKSPEAPEWAPFGQYAWAKYREAIPFEADTELEKQIYKELQKHFASTNRRGLPLTTANILSMFMVVGWYKSVLHPPPYKTLYRGLKFKTAKEASKYTEIGEKLFTEDGSVDIGDLKTMPIENGYSTSWSFKKQITKDFSEKGKRGIAVTLIADVKDNKFRFLAGPGGLYDVNGLSRWHLEKETVGLEPIKIKRIEWKVL